MPSSYHLNFVESTAKTKLKTKSHEMAVLPHNKTLGFVPILMIKKSHYL